MIEGQAIRTGGSIGIAIAPLHSGDADTLLRYADTAMYAAKRGRRTYALYDPAQDAHSPERLALLGELREAIAGGGLQLHYQPKATLSTGEVTAVEALARWPHPERGFIPPGQFIPLAEASGLIGPLTLWVLGEAVRQCGAWRQEGQALEIAVNLSAWTLHDPEILTVVDGLLQAHDVPPALLRLEVTESAVMDDPDRALDVLARLSALGVRLSIDDFGTGYSSLAYLKRLPVDELKIDQAFVRHVADDEADATIVRSTISLGHNLGLNVVAEGVEDEAAWRLLAEAGCDRAQGYYLARPMPAGDVVRWLQAREAGGDAGAAPERIVA
jgi:EAL domain-containing protein (putative c-di-GMP-specific phosphodiesterase class I)